MLQKNLKMEVVNKDCMKDYNLLDQAIIKKRISVSRTQIYKFFQWIFFI